MYAVIGALGLCCVFASSALADTFEMVPNPSNPIRKGIYKCEMRDGVSATDDGRLVRDQWADSFIERYARFEFDAGTGMFKTKGQTIMWVVLRPGDSAWDLVAHLPGPDTSFNMMRIEVWNDPVRFVMTNGKQFFLGLCELK
jgi:hypothetical protein